MRADQGRRLGTAAGFLCGLLACLDVLKDARVLWPPAALWNGLQHPQRLLLGGGIALILVSVVFSLRRPRPEL